MSNITNQILPEGPAVLTTFHSEWTMERDIEAWSNIMNAYFDALEQPHYYIMDLTVIRLNLKDVITGANIGARSGRPVFHHPKMIELLVATQDKATELAAKGMNSPIFGFVRVTVYGSVEEAQSVVRERLAQARS